MQMKKGIVIGALAGGLALGATAAQADTVDVANGTELAAAIVQANSDSSVTRILCASQGACDVTGTLPTYTGSHPLTIDGRFSTIDATGITDTDAFASVGGGKLRLIRLIFLGGMSGVYVEVPADREGTQRTDFRKVTVRDAALHGALVSDLGKSKATVQVIVANSSFLDNGLSANNQDGLRIEEDRRRRRRNGHHRLQVPAQQRGRSGGR